MNNTNLLILSSLISLYLINKLFKNNKKQYIKYKNNKKICVLTGAASGIGKVTTLKLIDQGWYVIAVDYNEKLLIQLKQEVTKASHLFIEICDLSKSNEVDILIKNIENIINEKFDKKLNALVNNAGIVSFTPVSEDFQVNRVFNVNFFAPMILCNKLLPLLLNAEHGRVCNITSIAGLTGTPWNGIYSATKGALARYTETIERECLAAKLNIRFTHLSPGPVITAITHNMIKKQQEWAENNKTSPFSKAILENNKRKLTNGYEYFEKMQNKMSVTPDVVANGIIESITLINPPLNGIIANPFLKMFFYSLAYILPRRLSDQILSQA